LGGVSENERKESEMNATTVAVDVAKNVFELAVADASWKVISSARLTRAQFERWFDNRQVKLVIMEACGSAHHWARWLQARGIEVRLLPAQYVRAYVKRNKTDAADARALLEAARASDMKPVGVKSVEQQGLQALHRTRSAWKATRTQRINALRGFCREFGLVVPEGALKGLARIGQVLADEDSAILTLLRGSMRLMLEEIRLLEARMGQLERELAEIATASAPCQRLLSVPGIGLITTPPWWARSPTRRASPPGAATQAFSGSPHENIRPGTDVFWAASPSAATATYAHS
jgi:transposase